ncbi:23S ribosomal RNA methyltransferase Erm [Agromyces sp. NPDC058104]|uniref:23S ribosomal RNA methyltransferase Erm n=1 Tax=Agromyces sp. NPDC058104 TaxID=3346342 RepID=UPI0036DF554E
MRTREHASSTPRQTRAGHGGRQELGQNFLVDRAAIDRFVALAAATSGPIVELGAGGGALTAPLARLGRPLTALELDPGRAEALRRRFGPRVAVEQADVLRWRYPAAPHVVVGNVPFHLTTAILRSLLERPGWTDAVLLTQWEAARRRCGVGGSSLLTAQSAPWFEFALDGRVPARAFRPVPAVDAGLFSVRRRADPLVAPAERRAYSGFVAAVFRGRGRGLAQILTRTPRPMSLAQATSWLARRGLARDALPGRLTAEDWGALWGEVRRR